MVFSQHGTFDVKTYENVLEVRMTGAWNLETAENYVYELRKVVQPLIGRPWVALTDLTEWELCTHDCEPILLESCKRALEVGLVYEAIINQNGVIKLEVLQRINPLKAGSERKIFADRSSAVQWLEQSGFAIKHDANA